PRRQRGDLPARPGRVVPNIEVPSGHVSKHEEGYDPRDPLPNSRRRVWRGLPYVVDDLPSVGGPRQVEVLRVHRRADRDVGEITEKILDLDLDAEVPRALVLPVAARRGLDHRFS